MWLHPHVYRLHLLALENDLRGFFAWEGLQEFVSSIEVQVCRQGDPGDRKKSG
jgi:hypothetical protein